MATGSELDGAALFSWARRASALLQEHRQEINDLNVFPVPDSDTGSNMAHTMAAAVREVEERGLTEAGEASDIAAALAVGSVKGARGNSGVVLSQVLRGFAQEATHGRIDGDTIIRALNTSVDFVERAIAAPVEGTIVTVLRVAAEAVSADAHREGGAVLTEVARVAHEAAAEALEQTPSQLAELREAGVVDAGAMGLVLLLRALHEEVAGKLPRAEEAADSDAGGHEGCSQPGWLEVMFFAEGDIDGLEAAIAPLGDSLVVARITEDSAKVHIHSLDAGRVIEEGLGFARLSDIRLEILPPSVPFEPSEEIQRLVVAVTPPGSIAELFEQAGAVAVHPGPDLASDVAAVVRRHTPREVIFLPSNEVAPGQLAEVEQAIAAATDPAPEVETLSSVRLISGIPAVAVHDPADELRNAVETMVEAAHEMRVGQMDSAGTAGTSDAVDVGEITVTVDDETIVRAPSVPAAIYQACATMVRTNPGEIITLLLTPDDAADIDTERIEADTGASVTLYPSDGLQHVGFIGVE